MIRLIAFFPLEGAAFYEEDGKSFHTTVPYTASVTEEVEEAEEFAQMTAGYLDGQGRTFPDFAALKTFLKDFQIEEMRSNPALVKNRELLKKLKLKNKTAKVVAGAGLGTLLSAAISFDPENSHSRFKKRTKSSPIAPLGMINNSSLPLDVGAKKRSLNNRPGKGQ